MNLNIFQWQSLKTKATLFTLVIFLISIWSLSFYASQMLRVDMQRQSSDQQFSTTTFVAEEVDEALDNHLRALEKAAGSVNPATLVNTVALQKHLEERPVFQSLFNGGIFATRIDGTVTASVPFSAERIGANYLDRDYIATALKEGKSLISKPAVSKILHAPIIVMVVPIRGSRDKVIGALAGVTNLGTPNFLDKITANQYGKTGGYLLIAPQYRLVVTATDKRRIMEVLPGPGISPPIDRFLQGYEGSVVFVNPRGEEVLGSTKGIPTAGWIMAAVLPTAEAFAPIRVMQQRMTLATLVLTLLAGTLTWWMLRRQLTPLLDAVKKLAAISETDQPVQPLPVANHDEIGQLIGGFNRLLGTLARREEALKEALSRLQKIASQVPGIVFQFRLRADGSSCMPYASEALREIYRVSPDEVRDDAAPLFAVVHPDDFWGVLTSIETAAKSLTPWRHEYRLKFPGEPDIWLLGNAIPQREDDSVLAYGFITDITERKQLEEAREEALSRLQKIASRLPGVVFQFRLRADGSSCVPYASEAIREIYRVSPDEVRDDAAPLFSAMHPDDFWPILACIETSAKNLTTMRHEFRLKFDDEPDIWLLGNAIPQQEADGSILWHGFITDITERKQMEAAREEALTRLQKIASRLPGVVLQFRLRADGSSCVPYASEALNDIYHISPEEVRDDATPMFAVVHPDDFWGVVASIETAAKSLTPWHHEYRLKFDGEPDIWLLGNAIPQQEADGSVLAHGFISDITERKQLEEAREEALTRLQKIASQVPGVVFQFRMRPDGSSCMPYASEALRKIYRVSPDEVRDDAKPTISTVHPDDLPEYLASVQASAKNLTPWHHEYRLKFAGEPDIWLLGNAMPQREADGSTIWHGFVTDITERKAAEDCIAHLAHHDALTGLLNRLSLTERLEQAMATAQREHRPLGVMFLDMDRFKTINDSLGHAVGDSLLVEVAQRLSEIVRNSDIVARLGGDEFVVVLTEVENAPSVARVAEKILKSLGRSYCIGEHEVHSTPSIGLAFYPSDGEDGETLMKHADTAMYHAKSQGRNNIQFFTSEMNLFAMKRLGLENDIRGGLATGQFELQYQPQMDGATGRFVGVEALLRWRNPQDGLMSPASFIQVAEETGLILPLGEWVLDEACRQLRDWRDQGLARVTMAVNLSGLQLRSSTLLAFIALTLEKHGLAGADLELEITESAVMDDPKACIRKLKALRKMGVRLSIDDFGTGYSSLSYLKLMPIQTLKVDQSFVHAIETNTKDIDICAATIALAHNLGLSVVAEGVETEAQRDFLMGQHCDFLQGFLFSKPIGAEAALAFFNGRKH